MPKRVVTGYVVLLSVLIGGCSQSLSFSDSIWNPLGLERHFGPHDDPVRIGLCHQWSGIFDVRRWGRKAPWDTLRKELQSHLGRPVRIENLEPFQIAFHLQDTGELDFALMAAKDYLELSEDGPVGRVLAISEARHRQGVIVARAGSGIHETADLKGKWFAFGPRNDSVLHLAAVAYLADAGVDITELKTFIPGQLQHHISSREVAKEVAYLPGADAGVIESQQFDAYPDTGGRWVLFAETYSKDQFHVLGQTKSVPIETIGEGPFLASERADPELVDKVRKFLLSVDREHPEVVEALGFTRFGFPAGDLRSQIKRLASAAD